MWEKGGGREREKVREGEREKKICMRVFRCCLMHVGVCVCMSVNCMDAAVCVGMVYVGIYVVNINV